MFNRGRISGGIDLDFVVHTPQFDSASKTVYNFGTLPIGDAHPERIVVVEVAVETGTFVVLGATVTIGGVSANVIGTGRNFLTSQIFWLKVPTGATANITVTCSNAARQCGIQHYSFNTPATAVLDSGQNFNGTGTTTVDNLECSVGGVVFIASVRRNATTGSIAWNGIDSDIEEVNDISSSVRRIFGYVLTTEASISRDATSTISGSGGHVLAAASFEGP